MDFMSFMAGLALTFFWLHTILIAAAGLMQSRKLWSRVAALRGALTPATVTAGDQGGALARHRVLQVGRTRGDGHVWFHDRGTASDGFGGALELEGAGPVRLEAAELVEVWPDPAELTARANRVDAAGFEAAAGPAKKARGWARELDTEVREGSQVWVHGEIDDGVLRAPEGAKVLISTIEPTGWMLRRARWGIVLAVLDVALAAGCTVLIFWPPMWGRVSMIGAFLALVAFNLFQLWGKLLRDGLRVPSEAFIRGHWARPA